MKRGAKLAVLACALAVLIGAWLLAESMSGRREAAQVQAAEAETIDIAVGAYEDVTALSWTYFGNTVNIAYDAEADKWVNTDDNTCPISAQAVEPLLQAVSSAAAAMEITSVTDFEQYGLEEPPIVVLAGAGDNIVSYEIGNTTLTGEYYVRVNGTDSVYTETGLLAPAFQAQLADMLALESAPEDIASVTGLMVETDVGSYEIAYRADGADFWYTDAYTWFRTGDDGEPAQPLEAEQAKSLYELVTDIRFLSCDTWNARSLSPYGLDNPQGVARVTYLDREGAGQEFTLEFGDYTSDGHVYVRLAGSRMVYLVSGAVLDGLMYPDWTAMTPLTVAPLNWTWLGSAVLETAEGERYEIVRSVSTPTQEGEEPEDIFTCGDRSLDEGLVSRWLDEIAALTADSLAAEGSGREERFKLTFRQESELWPEVTLDFFGYDSAHCLCIVNGQDAYLVSRTAAEALTEDAMEFLVQLPAEE